MMQNYHYCLGIDLGIASIGTALIRLDKDGRPLDILDAGVRIFDTPEGAAGRRQARQERKTIRRRRQRLRILRRFLHEHGLLGDVSLKAGSNRPYRLRAAGVQHKLDGLDDLSIGLLHIAKHRGAGFLSQMADEAEANDAKGKQKTRDSYDRITKELKEGGQTLGQFFWSRIQDKKAVRRRKSLVESGDIDYAVPRFLVKQDFHALWDYQAQFYPVLTAELKQQAYDLIFKDHPHAPYAKALCSLRPGSGEYRLRISPKPEHGLQGKLHDATKYRVLCADPRKGKDGQYIVCYKRSLSLLREYGKVDNILFKTKTLPELPEIIDLHNQCQHQHATIVACYDHAKEELENANLRLETEAKKPRTVNEAAIVQEAVRLARKGDKRIGHTYISVDIKTLVGINAVTQHGFMPGSNLRMDFYCDGNGKINWECMTRFAANQPGFSPDWQKDTHNSLIWSLHNGDVLEMVVDEAICKDLSIPVRPGKVLFMVQKMGKGYLYINLLHDARPLKAKEDLNELPRWVSGELGLSSFTKAKARKVEFTPFGKLRHKHRTLWYGKRTQKA